MLVIALVVNQTQKSHPGTIHSFIFLGNLQTTPVVLEEEAPTELKVLLTLTGTLTSLLKHTTEDPAPGCLSRRLIVKIFYFKL
jgi:hypothetical protein